MRYGMVVLAIDCHGTSLSEAVFAQLHKKSAGVPSDSGALIKGLKTR